jgi:hypothetical protein
MLHAGVLLGFHSSTLKMEATCSLEISVNFQRSTWLYVKADATLHYRLISTIFYYVFFPCWSIEAPSDTERQSRIVSRFINLSSIAWSLINQLNKSWYIELRCHFLGIWTYCLSSNDRMINE